MCSVFFFLSCTKDDEFIDPNERRRIVDDSVRTYSSSEGTLLTITRSEWLAVYEEIDDDTSRYWAVSRVFLIISGSTNADRVTVRNIGTGLFHEEDVLLDDQKHFDYDTTSIVRGHHGTPPIYPFTVETCIKAYRPTDTLVIWFESGEMRF